MGDVVEIITHLVQQPTYYRVSATAISFEIKGLSGAVGLAASSGKPYQYFITFGADNKIMIKGPQGMRISEVIPTYGLSTAVFRRFWIAWDNGLLCVGHNRDATCLHSYPNVSTDLYYVSFIAKAPNIVTWRLDSPPSALIKLAKAPCKEITGGELRWVQADNQLPDNAVVGGFEGECLYIVRGPHRGSLTPGKFVPSEGVAYLPWGGQANEVPEFEVLVGYNFTWVPTSHNRIPANAFEAGHTEASREKLYIGRATHMQCVVPGKVQPSHKVCYIAFEDKEVSFKQYEILTVPDSNPYADHNFCNNCKARNPHFYVNNDEIQQEYGNDDNDDNSDGENDSDQWVEDN